MWTKTNQIVFVVGILLIVAGIYYGSIPKETRLRDQMVDAVADHDHEAALIYATKLLKFEPSNAEAQKIISESGQIFFYLQAAKNTLTEFTEGKDDAEVNPKQLYEQYSKAREFIAKAKTIDPRSIAISSFEESLDKTQATLIHILSMKVFESGQTIVEKAGANYRKTLDILDVAESSQYLSAFLSHQSAWATVDTPVEEMRRQLMPGLDEMDDTGRLIAEYKEGSAKKFTKSLLTYIKVVKRTVDTLLVPEGSFDEFSKAASNATMKYKKIRTQLKEATPESISSKGTLIALLKKIPHFKVSHDNSIAEIVSENESLYSL